MKKMDYIVIIFVLIIGATIFASYFNKFNVGIDNAVIEIRFQNEVIAQIDYHEDINSSYTFESIDNNKVQVIIDDDGDITVKEIDVNQRMNIYNKVNIEYNNIVMHEANCPNQSCMRMKITNTITWPIICTNGVVITFVDADDVDLEVLIP